MNLLRKLKLEEQRSDGIVLFSPANKNKKDETITDLLSPKKAQQKTGECTAVDGKWITISDWTQCSLKCGGGVSTLQRQCIPPKNGGKNCEGPSILTRKCNTQPCPDGKSTNSTTPQQILKKPIIKVMRFTNSPQRYVKCKVKEGDLMLYQNMTETEASGESNIKKMLKTHLNFDELTELNLPVRIVMNNETISVYTGETTDTLFMSFKLKMASFYRHTVRKDCFVIKETENKKINLCQFTCNGKEVEEWDYDFHLFKNQCAVKPLVMSDITKELKFKLQYKIVRFIIYQDNIFFNKFYC